MYPAANISRKTKTLFVTLVVFITYSISLFPIGFCHARENETQFNEGLALLLQRNFKQKEVGIKKIAASSDPRSEKILTSLLAGKFYRLKKDTTLVYTTFNESVAEVTSAIDGKPLGSVKKRKLKKITINNKLRGILKNALAEIRLGSNDPKVREKAADNLLNNPTPESARLLEKLLKTEKDETIIKILTTASHIVNLRNPDNEQKILALDNLQGNLTPVVRNEISRLVTDESDPVVLKKAESVLASLDAKVSFYGFLETIFFGLSLGSVLVLAAIGLAITFGVIGVINMAHGELIMIGAYTTYVIQQLMPESIGIALLLSIPAAFCVSGLTGIIIERSVIRFLYGRPLETLLATFGISLVLQQTVRSIFSPLNRSVASPEWMSGSLQLNPILSLTNNRIAILVFSLLVFAGLYFVLKKSSIGLQVRAVSQNRKMARAMGIQAARVDALTFGLGSGIAGIAGVALSQLTNVGPNLGQNYIIDSFMVVVFGGVGNLWGTLIGGLSLGVANKFLEPWAGTVLAKILILVFIILFIQKRPQGLFPQKGRAAG